MNRDGSGQTRLTFEAAEDRLPAWSPNSRQITFQSARFGIPDIFIMDADGSNLRQVTDTPEREGHTSWSVNDQLVFNASLELFWQIYVSDVNGDDQQRLTNSRIDEWSPEWSSDGRRILFLSERESSINSGIYVMNADGTNVQLLYNSLQEEWGAVWSAGDSQILFTVDQVDGTADIYIMDVDGSNARRLIEQGSYPSWAAP
jgi:TolB protein